MSISTKHIKRNLFQILEHEDYQPVKAYELSESIGLHKSERKAFHAVLRALEEEGKIIRLRRNLIALPQQAEEISGTLSVHLQGFGFVVREENPDGLSDVFIPRNSMKGARHGDSVLIRVREDSERGPEGDIVRVLSRGVTQTTGTLMKRGKSWSVLPDDPRIAGTIRVEKIPEGMKPVRNNKVFFELHEAIQHGASPTAILLEDLGTAGASGVDVLSIMRRYGLNDSFPKAVEDQVADIKPGATEKEIARRKDCRGWLAYTIDPPDAKDHDDALSIRLLDNGNYELGIHIADVAHYVKEGTPLDREAVRRGNSAYLVDRVVPMLPNKLTTDLCSLVPYKDRLTHTALVELTPAGDLVAQDAFLSVIHSKAKLSYEQVQDYFDEGKTKGINKKIQASLDMLRDLTQTLRKARMSNGAIGFNVPEVRCELRKDGNIKRIVKRTPLSAYNLVEECMLLANKVVANMFVAQERPGIFRIHEEPSEEQWAEMASSLAALGIDEVPETKADMTRIIEAQEKALQYPATIAMLRNMQRAVYSADLAEHFGLGFHAYSHFTSPIRRYPDLLAHRVLECIEEKKNSPYKKDRIEELAAHCSSTERNAEEAEKETVQGKLIAHYEDRLLSGQSGEYKANVISFKKRGIICELEESLFSGMIPYPALPGDYYEVNESGTSAVGKRTGKTYRLGDPIEVMITRVDRIARQLEFGLA